MCRRSGEGLTLLDDPSPRGSDDDENSLRCWGRNVVVGLSHAGIKKTGVVFPHIRLPTPSSRDNVSALVIRRFQAHGGNQWIISISALYTHEKLVVSLLQP